MKRHDTDELLNDFIEAYKANLCQLVSTCEILGVAPESIYTYRKTHSWFDEALNKADLLLNERVERTLIEDAVDRDGAPVSRIFYLKNNWKQKYGERQLLEIQPGNLWFEQKPQNVIEGEIAPKQLEE
jgi:hypothetical protein